jgi:hypothetical protein
VICSVVHHLLAFALSAHAPLSFAIFRHLHYLPMLRDLPCRPPCSDICAICPCSAIFRRVLPSALSAHALPSFVVFCHLRYLPMLCHHLSCSAICAICPCSAIFRLALPSALSAHAP